VKAIFFAIALCLSVSVSHAEDPDVVSGNFFLSICKDAFSPTRPESRLDVYGYGNCVGVLHTLLVVGPNLDVQRRFCPPSNATTYDASRVSIAYLQANPQLLKEGFIELATDALKKAWPCK
jgi:hypothetical protein